MPTGYTAGIIDGTTPDFKTFALTCARAFGALMHMRDEPFDAPYKPQIPTTYYKEKLEEALKKLDQLALMSDEHLMADEKLKLISEKESYEKA